MPLFSTLSACSTGEGSEAGVSMVAKSVCWYCYYPAFSLWQVLLAMPGVCLLSSLTAPYALGPHFAAHLRQKWRYCSGYYFQQPDLIFGKQRKGDGIRPLATRKPSVSRALVVRSLHRLGIDSQRGTWAWVGARSKGSETCVPKSWGHYWSCNLCWKRLKIQSCMICG